MLTKEFLTEKRAELQKAYDDALAQMNAFGGALQFCDHLLSLFAEPEIEKAAEVEK